MNLGHLRFLLPALFFCAFKTSVFRIFGEKSGNVPSYPPLPPPKKISAFIFWRKVFMNHDVFGGRLVILFESNINHKHLMWFRCQLNRLVRVWFPQLGQFSHNQYAGGRRDNSIWKWVFLVANLIFTLIWPVSCDKTTFVRKAPVSMEGILHEQYRGNGLKRFLTKAFPPKQKI